MAVPKKVEYPNPYPNPNPYPTPNPVCQVAVPKKVEYQFRTQRKTPKLGLMLVGWGGNNGR